MQTILIEEAIKSLQSQSERTKQVLLKKFNKKIEGSSDESLIFTRFLKKLNEIEKTMIVKKLLHEQFKSVNLQSRPLGLFY